MRSPRLIWKTLAVVFVLSFAVLGWTGREIYLAAPPIPARVVVDDGSIIYTGADIQRGQQVWLAAGGQQLGSVWGHGGYVAPDWSADWLHREALALREELATSVFATPYAQLTFEQRAGIDARVKVQMRRNDYDADSGTLRIPASRAAAISTVSAHYGELFGNGQALDTLREQYAMSADTVPAAADRRALSAFFFWSSWAAATDRPGETGLSYTSNWPHEPLVGNRMTAGSAIWSIVSIILLIAGIAAMLWYHSAQHEPEPPAVPARDPLFGAQATASMLATRKYFFAVVGILLLQVAMGVITAHYAVEGQTFFSLPLGELLPYVVSRTIHTQTGIFWIATAWLATGLYIAPLLSGKEPAGQKLGVDLLFWALVAIVVGSTVTGWLGTLQARGTDYAFWIGNQGLEFTSMGRVWQTLLFVGLMFWLFLLGRALWPALRQPGETRGLIAMVFLSATCIGGFYATSLVWGQETHYSMIEYWRWWLVHLWVEGFFEVFATAVVALIFTRLGLIRTSTANVAIVMETTVFLFGGILGTLHHLYFTGAPTSVIALGAVFSAMEVVPLALVGIEGYRTYLRSKAAPWVASYRWPILFFVAVGFWNTVGAGLLGFSINPPASLYFVQGLNLTAAHGHAALFGVYGMLGIGLMLFCLRGLYAPGRHAEALVGKAFWCLNGGLAMMVFMSLLPAGIYQAAASITQGLWYARSPEIVHSPVMEFLVWMRVPGDIVFALGVLALSAYVLKLLGREPGELRQGELASASKTA
ncbi:MAG: nitric-oxide reductase large subunit [Gammaproteobacteria bacterium]|nr:nitric-oxide reductase large subunit [Gammaproteobacteria bacterium]MCP5140591.1 nitric-oxide reductase large subunit [Chromatiales bacterium]